MSGYGIAAFAHTFDLHSECRSAHEDPYVLLFGASFDAIVNSIHDITRV